MSNKDSTSSSAQISDSTKKAKSIVDFRNVPDKDEEKSKPNLIKVIQDDIIDDDDDAVVAPITLAPDGGWGWVVVAASFWHIFNLEGVGFSFGTMKNYILEDIPTELASMALINSITIGFMCFFGPVASALINRYGFRIVSMCGSTISAFAAFLASFSVNYETLLIFYGIIMGVGFSLIASSANLIVGFYFEKRRALATAIAFCGSSVGITINAAISHSMNRIGWRPTMKYQSAMLGTVFFSSFVYRPLLSITVQVVEPNLKKRMSTPYIHGFDAARETKQSVNPEYKLAVDMIDEQYEARQSKELTLESSTQGNKKSTIISTADLPKLTEKFSKVQVVLELSEETDKLLITIHNKEGKKRKGFWGKLFSWRPHIKEARPLYRDDAFYTGNVNKLESSRRSSTHRYESKTGIEYDLAVSRVTTAKDMKEEGIFSTAVKRVLISMADPRLLKLKSFSIFLLGVFFAYLGIVIPYIYIIDRSKALDIPKKHSDWFVSVIASSGFFGRLSVGIIASKFSALFCFQVCAFTAGTITMTSNFFTVFYLQYFYCIIYGYFMSGMIICRYLILIDMYGLELLTNGSGLVMFTMGLSLLFSPPIGGLLLTHFGVNMTFVYSGLCCIISGVFMSIVPILRKREKEAAGLYSQKK